MKQRLLKIACGIAAATLAFTLMACDDSSSATKPPFEEISSESNGGDGTDTIESSATAESSTDVESSDSAESSAEGEGSSTSTDESSASLDDNSSSSLAVTCQALTLECYSATQLCNKGLTEYCVNSSSSSEETCKHVSDVDGGTCQDYDTVKDCETGAYAVCRNNGWRLAIIGDNCTPSGDEMTVNEINLKCNGDFYWEYKSTIDNCPPGSSCQRPNYSCGTHPINGFSCNSDNGKVQTLFVSIWSASDCMYQCSSGKYHVVMPPAPVGN